MDVALTSAPPDLLDNPIARVNNQVSRIIRDTNIESKRNHVSFKQFAFFSNARKRTANSAEKKKQKKCSITWTTGCASVKTNASFISVSTAIQTALAEITNKVIKSNHTLQA